jgi:hypothetical protein
VIDPDAHPALVVGQVIDAVRDRFALGLAGEVVGVDLDWHPRGRPFPATVLELADQLFLLGVHRDHRLARRKRRLCGLVDQLELGVAIGVICTLARLAIGLQAVAERAQQPRDRAIADPMTKPDQARLELANTL